MSAGSGPVIGICEDFEKKIIELSNHLTSVYFKDDYIRNNLAIICMQHD